MTGMNMGFVYEQSILEFGAWPIVLSAIMLTSLQRLCMHRGMRWEPELREARNYGLSSARNVPVSSIITGWFSKRDLRL